MRPALALALCALAACQHAGTPATAPSPEASPYVGQETREIKALSADQIRGYLDGAGLGYARAAELNGYPGPRHVLDLSDSLALTADQRRRVEESFRTMQAEARARGREYVAAEAALDRAFSEGRADREEVRSLAEAAARIEGRVRAAHLAAHLDMVAVLTPAQVASYGRLRGYGSGGHPEGHRGHQH